MPFWAGLAATTARAGGRFSWAAHASQVRALPFRVPYLLPTSRRMRPVTFEYWDLGGGPAARADVGAVIGGGRVSRNVSAPLVAGLSREEMLV